MTSHKNRIPVLLESYLVEIDFMSLLDYRGFFDNLFAGRTDADKVSGAS
jgi:hypothetical protein